MYLSSQGSGDDSVPYFHLDTALQQAGSVAEREVIDGLVENHRFIEQPTENLYPTQPGETLGTRWENFENGVADCPPGSRLLFVEVELPRNLRLIGTDHSISGRIDVILVDWSDASSVRPIIRMLELKRSVSVKPSARYQLATYMLAMEHTGLRYSAVMQSEIHYHIVHMEDRDSTGGSMLDPLGEQSTEIVDLRNDASRLLHWLMPGGQIDQCVGVRGDDGLGLDHVIEPKCAGCRHQFTCMGNAVGAGGEGPSLRMLQSPQHEVDLIIGSLGGDASLEGLASAGEALVSSLQTTPGIGSNITNLQVRAQALLSGIQDSEANCMALPVPRMTMLPRTNPGGFGSQDIPTIRMYVTLAYDYVDDRLNGISAHVTRSQRRMRVRGGDLEEYHDGAGWSVPLSGNVDFNFIMDNSPDSGRAMYESEREMLDGFFTRAQEAIVELAGEAGQAHVHLYLGRRTDYEHLMKACARRGGGVLVKFRDLLGLRQAIDGEEVTYSCVIDELMARFALPFASTATFAMTGLGNLSEAAGNDALAGECFEWLHDLGGEQVNLGEAFQGRVGQQDSADDLVRHRDGRDRGLLDSSAVRPAYFRALWGQLDDSSVDDDEAVHLNRFGTHVVIQAHMGLEARSLRYIEERIRPSDSKIWKHPRNVSSSGEPDIEVQEPSEMAQPTALEYMRIDHHTKVQDWETARRSPLIDQVLAGRTLPLRNLNHVQGDTWSAQIDTAGLVGMTVEDILNSNKLTAGKSELRLVPQTQSSRDSGGGHSEDQIRNDRRHLVFTLQSIDDDVVAMSVRRAATDSESIDDRWQWCKYRREIFPDTIIIGPYTASESPDNPFAPRIEFQLGMQSFSDVPPDVEIPHGNDHVDEWFSWDEENPDNGLFPDIPERSDPSEEDLEVVTDILNRLEYLPEYSSEPGEPILKPESVQAVLNMLGGKIVQIMGPPGTGKTFLTALGFILNMTLLRRRLGRGVVTAVVAPTNSAVDSMMRRISRWYSRTNLIHLMSEYGWLDGTIPPQMLRFLNTDFMPSEEIPAVNYRNPNDAAISYKGNRYGGTHYHWDGLVAGIIDWPHGRGHAERAPNHGDRGIYRTVGDLNIITAGTTNFLLRHEERKRIHANTPGASGGGLWAVFPNRKVTFRYPWHGPHPPDMATDTFSVEYRQVDLLLVDEASMMPTSQFLAMCGLLDPADGVVMVAGDHAQLEPISAHNWDTEERRSIRRFMPHYSAYDTVQRIGGLDGISDDQVRRVPLEVTRRLPPVGCQLLHGSYLASDDIDLRCEGCIDAPVMTMDSDHIRDLETIWDPVDDDETGAALLLVVHDYESPTVSNPAEAEIVRQLVHARGDTDDLFVLTPFNIQKQLIAQPPLGSDLVKTVNEAQGDERDDVIISLATSDRSRLRAAEAFILDPGRWTVGLSRMKRRLIVVISEELLSHTPTSSSAYEGASLLYELQTACTDEVHHFQFEQDGQHVNARVYRPHPQWLDRAHERVVQNQNESIDV